MVLAAADDPRDAASDSGSQTIYVCLPGCTVGQVAGPGGNEGQVPTPPQANTNANVFSSALTTEWPGLRPRV